MSLPDRFWAKVDKNGPGGCWLWTASTTDLGYARLHVGGRVLYGHRLSFEAHARPLMPGEVVDHKCHVSSCVNPDHLQAVTPALNAQNLVGATARSKSGLRGVSWDRFNEKWRVTVTVRGKQHHIGRFTDPVQADEAARAARVELMTNSLADRRVA